MSTSMRKSEVIALFALALCAVGGAGDLGQGGPWPWAPSSREWKSVASSSDGTKGSTHRRLQGACTVPSLLPACTCSGPSALNCANLGLTSIPAGAFAGLASLTEIRLNSNLLTTLPTGSFTALTSLTHLYLDDNPL